MPLEVDDGIESVVPADVSDVKLARRAPRGFADRRPSCPPVASGLAERWRPAVLDSQGGWHGWRPAVLDTQGGWRGSRCFVSRFSMELGSNVSSSSSGSCRTCPRQTSNTTFKSLGLPTTLSPDMPSGRVACPKWARRAGRPQHCSIIPSCNPWSAGRLTSKAPVYGSSSLARDKHSGCCFDNAKTPPSTAMHKNAPQNNEIAALSFEAVVLFLFPWANSAINPTSNVPLFTTLCFLSWVLETKLAGFPPSSRGGSDARRMYNNVGRRGADSTVGASNTVVANCGELGGV